MNACILSHGCAAKEDAMPGRLRESRNKFFTQIDIAYSDGLRYPHREVTGPGKTAIDRLLSPRRTKP
jgi:hypothetical protein